MGNQMFTDGIPDKVPDYIISIKSGNKHGLGSTSSICLAFCNTKGEMSKDIEYKCKWGEENFKAGTVKGFPVYDIPNLGDLDQMELTQRSGGAWYVQWVEVLDYFTEEKFIFPVNRWMKGGKTITLKIYDSLLPQDDENIEERKKELQDKKRAYEFEWRSPGFIPLTKDVPADEEFPQEYKKYLDKYKLSLILQNVTTMIKSKKWTGLEDLDNIFGGMFPIPPGIDQWEHDRDFGARRLFSSNPCLLRLCSKIPDNLPVTDEMLEPLLETLTIEEAIQQKKLFIIDLPNLTDLPCKYEENIPKVCSPMVLFFLNKNKELMPVAIQLRQTPAKDNPIFLPTDPEFTWRLAKMWYCSADATDHQSATHLGLTHFLMESVCVATHRSLSPSHPIFRFLTPHLFNVIAINSHAVKKLISPEGWVNKIIICGVVGLLENIDRSWKTWRLDVQGNLPNDLRDRGVDDPEVLPNYYYRDDGLLYWDAIRRYARTVVEGHYDTLKKLEEDNEIQDWAKTLSSESAGCGIKGVPGGGSFQTREQLIETLTSVIYIGSVVHAAVNSPQYDQYSYPFGCINLRGTPPTDKTPVDEKHIFNTLLDKRSSLENMIYFQIVSTQGPNRLGDSEIDHMFDPVGIRALKTFRKDLQAIAVTIDERTATRTYAYPYLHPKEVTNSIGI